jgi:hypothetical protein
MFRYKSRNIFFMKYKIRTYYFFLIIFLCTICPSNAVAQLEAKNWYFGNYTGMRFDSNSPVPVYNSGMWGGLGTSTISDKNGNLLFYGGTRLTATLFNRQHDTMKNGYGLYSNSACDQSPMIIPLPGNLDIYYVFTVQAPVGTPDTNQSGFWYHIVDMSKDNGKGEVILKNQLICRNVNNKLAATLHADKKSVWVMTKDFYSNKLKAYLLINTGLDFTPVVSSVGTFSTSIWGDLRGQMKFSASGKKLANAIHYDCKIDIFDFNNKTGKVSNCITIDSIPNAIISHRTYGVEFSPNEKYLYFTIEGYKGQLLQLDISTYIDSIVKKSIFPVYLSSNSINFYCLQIGIDQKDIHCIRYPEII